MSSTVTSECAHPVKSWVNAESDDHNIVLKCTDCGYRFKYVEPWLSEILHPVPTLDELAAERTYPPAGTESNIDIPTFLRRRPRVDH